MYLCPSAFICGLIKSPNEIPNSGITLFLHPLSCSFMEINDAKYVISSPDYKQCPPPDRAEYAFIGRSNVGKSSLINMLCNKKTLAKTSSAPGKTQLINHFDVFSNDKKKMVLS